MSTDSDNSVLLEMRDVRIDGFSDERWHEIIKGVDLTLRRGEIMGLIGESGAGKSTLGLAAMGFARPGCRLTSGSIKFDGTELMTAPESEKRALWGSRICYVAQSAAASFNPAHRLIDQTTEAALSHGLQNAEEAQAAARELYRELYRAMQLPNPDTIGDRYPHQVSGGQLQRAMTAMAMASKPDLIIFDEPTTALDVTNPRPRGGGADGGRDQGVALWRDHGRRADPADADRTQAPLHQIALVGARLAKRGGEVG